MASEPPPSGSRLERAVERAVERALIRVLDSRMVGRVWEHLLASDEAQKLVERIAKAPEVRAAVAYQGVGLLADFGREVQRVTRRLDAAVERVWRGVFRRSRRQEETDRAGLVSRGVALLLDAAILNATFFAVSALIALALSLIVPDSDIAHGALVATGAGAWTVFGGGYLIAFWSLAGQTPGMRFLGLHLRSATGNGVEPGQALRRLLMLIVAVVPVGLGVWSVLTDERRRGFHDRRAATEVLYVPARTAPWAGERSGG